MATELIETGAGAAESADITVAAGEAVTVCLKAFEPYARVKVQMKDDGDDYVTIGEINAQRPATSIASPGTYRVARMAGDTAECGVFRD